MVSSFCMTVQRYDIFFSDIVEGVESDVSEVCQRLFKGESTLMEEAQDFYAHAQVIGYHRASIILFLSRIHRFGERVKSLRLLSGAFSHIAYPVSLFGHFR